MSLLQQSAGLPHVLSITGSLVAGFRRGRRFHLAAVHSWFQVG